MNKTGLGLLSSPEEFHTATKPVSCSIIIGVAGIVPLCALSSSETRQHT